MSAGLEDNLALISVAAFCGRSENVIQHEIFKKEVTSDKKASSESGSHTMDLAKFMKDLRLV